MEELQRKILAILAQYSCRYGIVIIKQNTKEKLELNPNLIFPSASMIKVPIMVEIMRQAAAGILSLEETLVLTTEVKVEGGILQELRSGHRLTILELVTLMIVLSDNTATNLLIDFIGMDAVNATMKRLSLSSTVLRRKMMDFTAAKAGKENLTSANDMALLFQGLQNGGLDLPPQYNDLMLDILKRQQIRDKLPFYLPEDVIIANKTGTLPGAEHDGGILYVPQGTYIISVFTDSLAANYEGLQLVAGIGKCIYDHITQGGLTND
jgi:beta-lactamase class A